MNYEDMSDFQINKWVVRLSGFGVMFTDSDSGKVFLGPHADAEFDPCNNPSDAWPIIVENNISVCKYFYADELVWGDSWEANYDKNVDVRPDNTEGSKLFHRGANPLRAAMVVFLKMKDSEGKGA